MRISADVREYAATHGLDSAEAIEAGMAEKSSEFAEGGSRVYLPLESRSISAIRTHQLDDMK